MLQEEVKAWGALRIQQLPFPRRLALTARLLQFVVATESLLLECRPGMTSLDDNVQVCCCVAFTLGTICIRIYRRR